MTLLLTGLAVFFGIHLLPSRPALREKLVRAIGEKPYKGVFAILSVAGLGLIVMGMDQVPTIVIWNPPPAAAMITAICMAPALILLAAANLKGNIKRIVRHPLSLGVLLWSLSHLLSNGDLAALLLFSSFALFALYNMRAAKRPAAVPEPPTSIQPDLLAGAIGMTAYFLLITFHHALFGVSVF